VVADQPAREANQDRRQGREHGIELAKLNTALQPETVFKYEGVNEIELFDFVPIGNLFVFSGSVRGCVVY
jgi:hypothetical protein